MTGVKVTDAEPAAIYLCARVLVIQRIRGVLVRTVVRMTKTENPKRPADAATKSASVDRPYSGTQDSHTEMPPSALASGFEPACTTSRIPSVGRVMRQAERDSESAAGDIEGRPGTVPTMTTDQIEEAGTPRQPGTASPAGMERGSSPKRIDLSSETSLPARPGGPLSRGGGSVGGSPAWSGIRRDFAASEVAVEVGPGSRRVLSADPGEFVASLRRSDLRSRDHMGAGATAPDSEMDRDGLGYVQSAAAQLVGRSTDAQGLPAHVGEPAVLQRFARLIRAATPPITRSDGR